MGPNHESIPSSTAAKVVMSAYITLIDRQLVWGYKLPCILHNNTKVVLASKFHGSLYISHSPGIDTDRRNTSLFTRNSEGSVQITSTDGTILENVGFQISVFVCTGLVGAPDRIAPMALYVRTIPGWIVNRITGGSRGYRMDEGLGQLRRQRGEVFLGGPA
jgi:hypothetical protein